MEKEKLNLLEKLSEIQNELKAPKGQYNSFGKYKYRKNNMNFIEELTKKFNKIGAIVSLLRDLPENVDKFLIDMKNYKSKEKDNALKLAKENKQDIEIIELNGLADLLFEIIIHVNDENIENITNKPAKEIRLHCTKLLSEIVMKISEKLK